MNINSKEFLDEFDLKVKEFKRELVRENLNNCTEKQIDLFNRMIELILGDVDCHHEVDHEEGGTHMSGEYNLNNETKLREKIGELIERYRRIK